MDANGPLPIRKLAELSALIAEIRDRVRARHPQAGEGRIDVPDLLPILHARDAAYAKVASIGSVNPRRGGPLTRSSKESSGWCRERWTGTCAIRWSSIAE